MTKFILSIILCFGMVFFCAAQSVTIGTQVWMTRNLNVSTFRNGDPIPHVKNAKEWDRASDNKQPAWCYYENDSKNGEKYGKLYNWYAVNDSRGLAPNGWHIASDAEWTILTNYLGSEADAGIKLKSTTGWDEDGNGTNSSGFLALPGGFRYFYGAFHGKGHFGYWWSSSEEDTKSAWKRVMNKFNGIVKRTGNTKGDGFYVRCIKD